MHDVIIIGGGVAGLGAAVYTGRFNLKTLLFAEMPGGTITLTHLVENYPGYVSLSGQELADHFIEHAKSVGTEIKHEKVIEILKNGKFFSIKTAQNEYQSKTIIFATGTEHKKLNVPSVIAFENRGVSYCATCDGPLFRGKTVAVVGSGDSAAKEALLLTEYAEKVYMIVRKDDIHPEPINKIRVEKNKKIEIVNYSTITEAKGEKFLEKIVLDSGKTIAVQGLFIEIGRIPQTDLAKKLGVTLNNGGEITIDRVSRTNIPGFFAAGDCTDTQWKQAITGVGEAAHAANSAYEYITHEHIEEA